MRRLAVSVNAVARVELEAVPWADAGVVAVADHQQLPVAAALHAATL